MNTKIVLGLDIGSNSIGWALLLIEVASGKILEIIKLGVRIIPLNSAESQEFTKGNTITKNADRRQGRGARRLMARYKLRRYALRQKLMAVNMMPDAALFQLNALELYGLRARGVRERLELQEFGRVLFHLNQKRGYKSNRKANNTDEEEADTKGKQSGYLDAIKNRETQLKQEDKTIGEHFYAELLKHEQGEERLPVRIKENIYMRASYENEFDKLWSKQQEYYPEVLTEQLRKEIRDRIIYYQRPLKSQKALVSNCIFERKLKASPRSSPLFQAAKIWQELNNIKITSFTAREDLFSTFNERGERTLTLAEKTLLFNKINTRERFSTKEILKEIGLTGKFENYRLNIRKEKELEGNRTLGQIKNILEKFGEDQSILRFDLPLCDRPYADAETGEIKLTVCDSVFKQPVYELWHLIYSVEEPEVLVQHLTARFNLKKETAAALAKLDFQKQGHGSLSAKALRNILPFLMGGYNYADACMEAGYKHSDYITTEENNARKLSDKLELYKTNSLRQPVVEKILNQVINLVNEIIDEANGYVPKSRRDEGSFEVRIELARELQQNIEERNRAYKANTDMDKRHREIEKIIKQDCPEIKRVSRNDIERYKLWEEFNQMSPYEPEKIISIHELFDGTYDIEHIIPKSRIFDNAFSNKTICPRRLNSGTLAKNQMTAFDFMKSRGEDTFLAYEDCVKKAYRDKKISKAKYNKLLMSGKDIPEEFIERQLKETQYITREVKKHLQNISRNVYVTSGGITSYLRAQWNYDKVLQHLNWPKYEGTPQARRDDKGRKFIDGWTKREDHRHHAVDALVVACTTQGHIQYLNNLNKIYNLNKDAALIPADSTNPIKNSRPIPVEDVCQAVDDILISFKAGKRLARKGKNEYKRSGKTDLQVPAPLTPKGFLHKETVYGKIHRYEQVKLGPKFIQTADIANTARKNIVENHLLKYEGDASAAFNKKNLQAFTEQYGFSTVSVLKPEYVVKYKLDTNFKVADVDYIIDEGIKRRVKAHLALYDNDPKKAFAGDVPVFSDDARTKRILSVRCFSNLEGLVATHDDKDFVSTRNNHHMAIYEDESGQLSHTTVTFWEALKRKQAGLPVICKDVPAFYEALQEKGIEDKDILSNLPPPGSKFVTSLSENEMFIVGLSRAEVEEAIAVKDYSLISKYLYRVQKFSRANVDIVFRHHLETNLDDKKKLGGQPHFVRIRSLPSFDLIKVKVTLLGDFYLVANG